MDGFYAVARARERSPKLRGFGALTVRRGP